MAAHGAKFVGMPPGAAHGGGGGAHHNGHRKHKRSQGRRG